MPFSPLIRLFAFRNALRAALRIVPPPRRDASGQWTILLADLQVPAPPLHAPSYFAALRLRIRWLTAYTLFFLGCSFPRAYALTLRYPRAKTPR